MQSEENKNCTSAFWGICCEGGKKYSQVVKQKFHMTMAALDPTVVPTSPVVSLMVDRGGCEYLLCSLKPSTVLQVNLNLYFDKGEKVTFSLRGQGKIHLSGYHIYDKSEKTDIIEASKNTSPVKKQTPTIVKDNKPKQNAVTTVKISDDSSSEDTKKTVSPKMNPNPQQKNSPASKKTEESEDEDDDDMFDELDDSMDDDDSEEETDAKKDAKKLQSYKRLWSSQIDEDVESDEDSDDSDSDEMDKKQTSQKKPVQVTKKLKIETPSQSLKKSENATGNKMASPKKALKLSDDVLNSSLGRTPMPQKKAPMKPNQANALTPKKVTFSGSDDSDSDEEVVMTPSKKQPTESNSVQTSEKKKKRKKKKKSLDGLNTSNVSDGVKEEKTGLPSLSYNKKFPNGLEFEDIRVGNGPVAAKGKTVHVYYTGMLNNNKVFDSCKPGERRPFSFKLGSGEVIKGWDLAIEGMKVGGKRRMKIPAQLGYKNKAAGPIPPNSTLYFSVDLKAVN